MNTQAHQDYLKAVYTLSAIRDWVTTSALAAHLGVRPSSVTSMVKKLSAATPRLLDYKPQRGVALTDAGRRIALDMMRRHRLIELFLVSVMGLGWEEVHEEAEHLEHCVSDRFVEKLDILLGHPTRDPHGRPIPSPSGELPTTVEIPLTDIPENETVSVSSVGSEAPEFLRYLKEIGLTPDTVITVIETAPAAGTLDIEFVAENPPRRQVVGTQLAENIFVSKRR